MRTIKLFEQFVEEFIAAEPSTAPAPTIAPPPTKPKTPTKPSPIPVKRPFPVTEPAKAELDEVIARLKKLVSADENI
jgi:hypothetical protein